MPMFQMQLATDHPVLFLSDSSPDFAIPPDIGQSFATTTEDCLCFWVLSSVDGASLVTISDQNCQTGGVKLFDGAMNIPTGVVTLSDSGAFRYINVPVSAGEVSVEIWAEHARHPEWVWLKLGAIGQP